MADVVSVVHDLARAFGGTDAARRLEDHEAARRAAEDTFAFHGFTGEGARFVFDLFDGVEFAQEVSGSLVRSKSGGRQIDSRAYSRLLFGVEQGDAEVIALYERCGRGEGDADAIEAYAERRLSEDPPRRRPRRIEQAA